MKKSEVRRSPVLRGVLALACVCALFALVQQDREPQPYMERGELFAGGDDSKEYKFAVNEHEECVRQLTKMSSTASTSPDALVMFPTADKFELSIIDAKGEKRVLNQREAVSGLKDSGLRLRLAGLANSIAKQHKVLKLGKQSVFIFKDNTVAIADLPSCMVHHVYLSNRGQVHPDVARKVHENMKIAQDKGRPPSGCNGIPYVDPTVSVDEIEAVEEDAEEDEVAGKEALMNHEACADQLKAHMTSKMELPQLVENGMVNIGLPDGSVKRQSVTSLEPKFRAYVWNRYPLMIQLNGIRFSHKNLAKGATSVFLFPDNTVVVADNTKCKVTGVYFSDRKNEIHPELQSDLTPKVIARADKKGRRRSSRARSPYCRQYREGMCQTRHAGACKTRVRVRSRRRSSVRRSVTNACTLFDAGPRNTKCSDFGKFPWCNSKFCYKYHRPAYTCLYAGKARCWVHTTRKHGRRHHRRQCGNYNARYLATNKRRCPVVHCCRVAKCPLIVMPDCTASASQAAHHITDTSTAVTNAVSTVQTGLAIGMGVISMSAKLTAAFPAAGLVLGVFSAVLGFAGNAGMTGEQALQKSKEYTDKVAKELKKCMDQKFALAWEQHMDAQFRTLKVILNSGELLSSSPNLAMQRMTQVWNVADPVCIHMSSLFAEYNRHHANRDNGYRVATKGLFFMQVCSAMYTSQMADMKATRFALTATLNRMQAVNYEIDTYIKWHCRRFLGYYTRKDKCANIPEVQVKYRYLEHNVVLPSTLLAQSSYGGRLTSSVVIEYRRRWVRFPKNVGKWWEELGTNVVDPADCKKQCLVKSTCFAALHDAVKKSCIGSKRRTLFGNTYPVNKVSTVYLIVSRSDSAVDLKPKSTSSCCDRVGRPHRTMCMHLCYANRRCVGSRFYRGRCYYAWSNGRRQMADLDYVIVRRAKVMMMKGFAYHGSWPNRAPFRVYARSMSDCVALCAARGNCVALDLRPHGRGVMCNLCYTNTFYPEVNKFLKPWVGQPNSYHVDLYRTNLNRIYAPFLGTYTNIKIGKGVKPISGHCGVRAVFAFACPRRSAYRLNRPRGIGGNSVSGPMYFTGGVPSTMSNSNHVFPRRGGDLSVVLRMKFDARNRMDWIPVVNKIQDSRRRNWGMWVHPTSNGQGTWLLLQRYVGTKVNVHTRFNLASKTQVFTVGFTCQARGRAVLYVNGQAKASTRCTDMYANFPLRVGGSIHRVHSWLYGTIYKLSLFDRALSAIQMRRVMANSCNQC